ncbi:MAG: SusC/RagA family TonB-linked outer membrane protein [Chitinophagaceae bacterium]|nr:SusC/RagA family TonB-linked outer membrane protein [Chitinophagaceae bacterium]
MPKVLLLVVLFVSLNGLAQTFTFSFQRASLAKVFAQIEQRSDYRFLYSEEVLALGSPVSFTVNNTPLDSILRLCFFQQPLGYTIEGKHIIVKKRIIEKPTPLTRELRGKVVDMQNEPLAGITITIKQTGMATATDAYGEFVFMNLPVKTTLVVTGGEIIPQEVDASQNSYQLIVVEQRMSVLDETMVIAYGKTSRRLSTGTVSSVKREEISKQPVSNIMSVLAGRVPGLSVFQNSGAPGTGFDIQLRGINSIANGTDPLIVIDGIPYPSQTLTGAIGGGAGTSASPLNTLNPADVESIEILKDADATAIYGSRGANGVILITTIKGKAGKTSVTANLYQGYGQITRKMKLLGTTDYLRMRREAYSNDGTIPTNANAPDLLVWDTTRQTDWQDVLLGNTMHSTDAKVNLSGGSALTQFLFGLGYHKETTVYPGRFGENRKTANLNVSHASTDKRFQFSVSTTFADYGTTLPQQDLVSFITLSPNAPKLYNDDGTLNWQNGTWINPLGRTKAIISTTTTNLISSLSASYKLLPSLSIKISGGYNRLENNDHSINPKSASNPLGNPVSTAQFGRKTITTLIGEPQVEYQFLRNKNTFSILAGTTFQQNSQYFLYQRGTGYASDELLNSLRSASQVTTISEGDILYKYVGLFSRIKINLENKYLITATLRRDGSSRYGEENRFSNFGSIGAAWIFSNEKWFSNWKFLSFGKLKGSAGITGNDQIGDYKYLDLYSPYTYSYLGSTVFYPEQLYNPVYGWEKVRKLEASLEFGVWDNRLLGTVNYYHNTTTNQLVNYPLPSMTGFTSIVKNIPAVIRNTGIELELQGQLIKNKYISWSSSFNLTIPRNKLVSFQNLSSSSYANRYVIGEPLNIVKKYKWTGVNPATGNHQFEDFNRDGQITVSGDQQQIVFTGQRFFGGMQHNISYGRWELSLLLAFARTPSASNHLYVFSRPGLVMNQPVSVMNRWQKPGDITDVQRFANTSGGSNTAFSIYRQSDAAYSDASFIRLKNAVISYSVLATKKEHRFLSQCQLFLKANNLFTISRYSGVDPETLSIFMPPIRLVTAGFQVTFK